MVTLRTCRWTILLWYTQVLTWGLRVHVYTDIDVTLGMGLSTWFPPTQTQFGPHRGLPLPGKPYWQFKQSNWIDQNETGDTYYHTFDLPIVIWDAYRSYMFRATRGGFPCVSTSPIFQIIEYPYAPTTATVRVLMDTRIRDRSPNTNYGTNPSLWLANGGPPSSRSRILLQFPKPDLPEYATIMEATLTLYIKSTSGNAFPATTYYMTRPNWHELLATWNVWAIGEPWTTPGGDYAPTFPPPSVSASTTLFPPWRQEWNMHLLVAYAYQQNKQLDYLIISKEGLSNAEFYSRDTNPPAVHGKLDIVWAI